MKGYLRNTVAHENYNKHKDIKTWDKTFAAKRPSVRKKHLKGNNIN